MNKYVSAVYLIAFLFTSSSSFSQSKLKPGFNASEYLDMLNLTVHQADTPWTDEIPPLARGYKLFYRSDTLGLNNRWDLWLRDDSVAVINIRGTVMKPDSWTENFYAAMLPAKGSMIIDSNLVFIYKLADYSGASVHAGWLIALAYLSTSIVEKINVLSAYGIKDYIITGHSQGGALAYFVTAYLYYLDKERIPEINFKTYCSAPPKPGNMFFAYDYDYIRRGGWSLRVYNSEDWVPQTPISIQTQYDYAAANPYSERDSFLVKMNMIDKLIFEYTVGRLTGSLTNARDVVNEYFGKLVYDYGISKFLPHFPAPDYTNDTYYYPCGEPVVLMKQPGYDEYIAKTEHGIPYLFKDHMIQPYVYNTEKIYLR